MSLGFKRLKSDKENGYFTWRPIYMFHHTWLNSSSKEKYFRKKNCWENQNFHFMYHKQFFFFKNRTVWDNVEVNYCRAEQATDYNTIWRKRFSCCINKDTNTHSENVIFIYFPLQRWLHERVPMLLYVHSGANLGLGILGSCLGR